MELTGAISQTNEAPNVVSLTAIRTVFTLSQPSGCCFREQTRRRLRTPDNRKINPQLLEEMSEMSEMSAVLDM